jgi:hypothetical protein
MTKLEKAELALIPLAGFGFLAISPSLPRQLGIGNLLLTLSALLLLQSLIRDLFILSTSRRTKPASDVKPMRCLCAESAFGMSGIVAGAAMLGVGFDLQVVIGQWAWGIAVVSTFGVGFSIKDFILQTNPWRIVRDQDHLNIVVSWKK